MGNLNLKDIFIGKTDAKNEFVENSEAEKNTFIQSFLKPDNLVEDDFLQGKRYFITGLKGTGKTALMRYLGIVAEKEQYAKSAFVLFKSEIGEDERIKIEKAAEIITRTDGEVSQFKDYELPWMWFLFRRMINLSEKKGIRLFNDNEKWFKFKNKVESAINKTEPSYSLFPKLKHGKVEFETKVVKGSLDFDSNGVSKKEKNEIDFVKLVKDCESIFPELSPTGEKLYMFIDELELSLGSRKKYQRDIELIRDLILAINKFNRIARIHGYGIYCITGIRREVIAATASAGKEINKPISDFGISLRWQQSGGNITEHPLIKIIHKRLMSAESLCNIPNPASEEEVWCRYFPEKINEKPSQEFILNKTWYRPRDIIRFLGIAQQQFPMETSFSQYVIESINKDYSTECWEEQKEELTAYYSSDDINGMELLLMGLTSPFSLNDFNKKCNEIKEIYGDVEKLLEKRKPADILSDLYAIGVIGNTGEKMRFAFRGDNKILLTHDIVVHGALWNVLSIQPKNAKK